MNRLKNILLYFYKKPTAVFFLFLAVITIDRGNRWKDWDDQAGPFTYDVKEYYAPLPYFLLNDHDNSLAAFIQQKPRTIGMAMMYTPFFAAGHLAAKVSGAETNGFSKPYQEAVHYGTLLYFFIGLWVCRKSLVKYFSEAVSCICLAVLVFGTNLFYYTYSFGEMPHVYLFFLYTLFIHYSMHWVEKTGRKPLLVMAALLGLIVLIRPTDGLIILFPLLFKVDSRSRMKERVRNLFQPVVLLPALLLFIVPFLLQLIYWKIVMGSWIMDTYQGQRFFFGDPQLLNFLLSYRKGWLVYTPVMIFSLIGMILLWRRRKEFFWPVVLYFVLSVYLLSCWWDWAFGGSFGCRALVQSYALLSFPLAACIDLFWYGVKNMAVKYSLRVLWLGLLAFFIYLNLLQSEQYNYNVISWNGMTKEAYWSVFMKEDISETDREQLNKMIRMPDDAGMMKGERDE
jgi:hypothetical protein